jgi:hypothetical protein
MLFKFSNPVGSPDASAVGLSKLTVFTLSIIELPVKHFATK